MNHTHLIETLKNETQPVILEFWAPWCAPCKMMAPALDQLTKEYAGQVTVKKINADQHADLLRSLRVMAVPTILIFRQGKEVQRRVGAQSPQQLRSLFERLAQAEQDGEALPAGGMDPLTRLLRLGSGAAIGLLGFSTGLWLLVALGGLVAFWGWYDRCPVWQALYPRLKSLFRTAGGRQP